MSFINTQQSVTYSGLGRSVTNDGYASATGIAFAQSGAQTIASGAGVLFGVIGLTGLLSGGGGATASQSGCVITVIDAISGATPIVTSGAASLYASNVASVLYQFNFGAASGAGTGGLNLAPPDLTGINAVFRSGLVVVISGGVVGTIGVEVLYTKGV